MKESDKERTVANYFRGEWEKLRTMNLREKIAYIWEYYKLHLLIVTLLSYLLITVAVSFYTEYKAGKIVFGIGIVNDQTAGEAIEKSLASGFGEHLGLVKGKQRINVNASYSISDGKSEEQALINILMFVDASSGEIDAAICDKKVLDLFVNDPDAWLDLSTILDEITAEKLSDRFYYTKGPDEKDFPCGIYLPDQSLNTEASLSLEDPILVFLTAGKNRDYLDDLVNYLFEDELK